MADLVRVLLAVNVALPLCVFLARNVRAGRVELDHVALFSFGFLYYWMTPVAVALLPATGDDGGLQRWYQLVSSVGMPTFARYLALCLLWYVAFVAGAALGRAIRPPRAATPLPFSRALINLLFPVCVLVGGALVAALRHEFFAGYDLVFETDGGPRGPLLAFTVFVLSVLLVYLAKDPPGGRRSPLRALANHWGALYGTLAFATLALGGRMYVVTGIAAIAAYWSIHVQPLRLGRLLLLGLVGAMLSGLVGVIRFGLSGANVGVASLGGSLLLEPVFTSFSLVDFLRQGRLELFNAPISLLSQLLNLVPTFLLPDKVDLMVSPEDLGYSVTAPFGALSAFVSFMVNFGALGSAVALFVFSFALQRLRQRGTVITAVMYAMICGFLPFSFFRDPFYASIVKSILQLGVLMPLAVLTALHVLTVVARRRPTVPMAAAAPRSP